MTATGNSDPNLDYAKRLKLRCQTGTGNRSTHPSRCVLVQWAELS